ncbi:MAG: hypothetical protein GWN14_25280 [candidate division Zixibacteria bacterium]|nr:hypothetical protein [candidate division Zixibacteria bacterium]NIX59140.1 hypothetical protein [candidate division Zixibacteria bacterium]
MTSASSEVSAITSPGTASGATQDTDNPEACYIATAAYGSYLDPHVQSLRDFRDKYLMKTAFGRELVGLYYRTSPPVAELISRHESARTAMRVALTPVVYGVKYPVLGFAMVIGSGSLGAAWLRRRRKNRSQA